MSFPLENQHFAKMKNTKSGSVLFFVFCLCMILRHENDCSANASIRRPMNVQRRLIRDTFEQQLSNRIFNQHLKARHTDKRGPRSTFFRDDCDFGHFEPQSPVRLLWTARRKKTTTKTTTTCPTTTTTCPTTTTTCPTTTTTCPTTTTTCTSTPTVAPPTTPMTSPTSILTNIMLELISRLVDLITPTNTTPLTTPSRTNTTTFPTNSTTAKPTEKCIEGFHLVGDQCYYFSETGLNQSTAINQCRSLGTELAQPRTLQQHTMLTTYIKASDRYRNTPSWLIGGWKRMTGAGVEPSPSNPFGIIWRWNQDNHSLIEYNNWVNNTQGNHSLRHCMQISRNADYKWIDKNCDNVSNYICHHLLPNHTWYS